MLVDGDRLISFCIFAPLDDIQEDKDSRVYRKDLAVEGTDKERRYENGTKWKAEIVKAARNDVD